MPLRPAVAPKPSMRDHLEVRDSRQVARERTCAAAGLRTQDEHCPYHFSGSGKLREVKVSGVHVMQMWIGQYGGMVLLKWVVLRNLKVKKGNREFFAALLPLHMHTQKAIQGCKHMIHFFCSAFLFSFLKRVSLGEHSLENGRVPRRLQNSLSQRELLLSCLP